MDANTAALNKLLDRQVVHQDAGAALTPQAEKLPPTMNNIEEEMAE